MGEAERLRLLLDGYSGEMWKCIRCGFCNSVCPTSNASFSYMASKTSRGRLILLQALDSNVLKLSPFTHRFQDLIDLCFGCRRCLEVCPAGVRIPQLMWRVRYAGRRGGGRGKLRELLLSHYGLVERLGSRVPRLANLFSQSRFGRRVLELIGGIDRRAPLPPFHGERLEDWIRRRSMSARRGRLAYFIDVFTNYHEVELGKRVVEALERLGYGVEAPEQREAGTLLLEEGALDEAEKVARFNVEKLYEAVESGAKIITTSPAAYLALKQDYPELLGDGRARWVAEETIDVMELILREWEEGRIRFRKSGEEAVYHHSCFTKASGLTKTIERALKAAGYQVKDVEECCGVAGIWGITRRHYEEALDVGSRLFTRLRRLNLPVFSQSETCRLQIRHKTGLHVEHPVEGLLREITWE